VASRISLPHLHLRKPSIDLDWRQARDIPARVAAWRPPRGRALRVLLFQIVSAPLWLSSGIPAPALPPRDQPLPPGGLAGDHVARLLNQLVRRIWIQRILSIFFRAAWLPLLIGAAWIAVELRDGPDFNARALIWIECALLIPSAIFALLVRPTRREIARMLDRSFELQDRMVTALENVGTAIPGTGERASVTYLQMADAANIVTELKTHPAFRVRPPVREFVLAVACALLLAALFFMRGVGGGIPALVDNAVPLYTPAAERLAAAKQPDPSPQQVAASTLTKEEVEAQAARSAQAQQDLKKLADALEDQAVTRSAAEAIKQGDYEAAADLIRAAAENADQMSEAARNGLADDLEKAANEMSDGSQSLADAAREAAEGLREGGEAAKQGLSQLGDEIDQTATDIVSQQQLAENMRQANAAESEGKPGGQSSNSENNSQGAGSASEPSDDDSSASDSQETSGQGSSGSESNAAQPQDEDNAGEEGGDQSAGTGDTSSDDTGGTTQEGNSQPGGDKSSQPTSQSMPGDGTTPGEASSDAPTSNPDETGGQGQAGNPGAGAGGTNSDGDGGATISGQPSTGNTGGEDGEVSPEETEAPASDGEGEGAKANSSSSVVLSRSIEGESVITSSNGGAATTGAGAGATVGSGTAAQGAVGDAGPDSNRVPAEYRDIVEDYFSDQDGS
jgi:hypothetical protein